MQINDFQKIHERISCVDKTILQRQIALGLSLEA